MKNITWFTILLTTAILVSGCGKQKEQQTNPEIITSIFPIYDITANISPERGKAGYIVPIGANPHTFEPVPSMVARLQKVKLFIGINHHFDGWVEKYIPQSARKVYLAEALKDRIENHHHNPHIWLSLVSAKTIATTIAHNLTSLNTADAGTINSNLTGYLKKLDTLNKKYLTAFSAAGSKSLVQWHPAWNYVAEDYGLTIAGTIQSGHGDKPSVKKMKELTQTMKSQNIRVIVVGLRVQSSAVETLARETGARILPLDSLGDPSQPQKSSYLKNMEQNLNKLLEALK